MSELRKSTPPVPPMSGDAGIAKPKPRAKAAVKPAPAKRQKVAARVNAKGEKLRCMVMLNANTQCANPGRHPHSKAWTCSTHDRSIRAGVKVSLRGKATLPYVAPHSAADAR